MAKACTLRELPNGELEVTVWNSLDNSVIHRQIIKDRKEAEETAKSLALYECHHNHYQLIPFPLSYLNPLGQMRFHEMPYVTF